MSAATQSQAETVLKHLKRFGKLTAAQAWDRYRIQRLAARIMDLKERGFIIHTRLMVEGRRRWGQYEFTNDQPEHAI